MDPSSSEALSRLGMFLLSREDLPLIADTHTLARTRARDLVKRMNDRRNERLTETQRAEVDHLRFASVEQVEYLLARVEVRNDRLYRVVKPTAKQSAKGAAMQYILWEDLRSELAAVAAVILRDPKRVSLAGWKMPMRKVRVPESCPPSPTTPSPPRGSPVEKITFANACHE